MFHTSHDNSSNEIEQFFHNVSFGKAGEAFSPAFERLANDEFSAVWALVEANQMGIEDVPDLVAG